jgi:hypothetical protein
MGAPYPAIPANNSSIVCEQEAVYKPRQAEESILYGVVAENLETFLLIRWSGLILQKRYSLCVTPIFRGGIVSPRWSDDAAHVAAATVARADAIVSWNF